MDGFQLSQDFSVTTRRQFTFYHQGPWTSWYSFDRTQIDERLSQLWSPPVVLNLGLLDPESSARTPRPLLLKKVYDKDCLES